MMSILIRTLCLKSVTDINGYEKGRCCQLGQGNRLGGELIFPKIQLAFQGADLYTMLL